MKNIIVVFHDNNIYSGATKSFLSNVEMMHFDKEINVIAIVPRKPGELIDYLEKIGVKCIKAKFGGNVYEDNNHFFYKWIGYIRCFLKTIISYISCCMLIKHIKHKDIAVVYSNTSTIYFGAWLASKLNCIHIWHFREFGKEDQNSLRIFNKSFILMAKKAKYIIFISEVLKDYYLNKYGFINSIVLYNDISNDYVIERKSSHKIINILITGTLCEEKGQMHAIKAIEKLNNHNLMLYIVGKENSYITILKNYIEKQELKNIVFCGLVKQMNQLREKIDISIVCAKKEAFGRTVIEDMLANILVIGSNSGAIPELIKNHETGILYEYGNIDDLVNQINYALNNIDKVEKMKAKAFDNALLFTHSNTAKSIIKMLKELV